MNQHTFSVVDKPRVVIRHVEGNLTVRSHNKHTIAIRVAGENEDGSTAQPYIEGETIYLNDCHGAIELYVPYEKGYSEQPKIRTDISVSDLHGTVTMENVGNVDLQDISDSVTLTGVEGSLRATNVSALHENEGISGSALLTNVSRVEIGMIGATLQVSDAETVNVGAVGGAVQAKHISAVFHCGTTGGSCELYDSPDTDVALSNVGGNLHIDGVTHLPSCIVGGSLVVQLAQPSPHSSTQLTVGGSATLGIPRDANLRVRIMAGGSINGNAVQQKQNNMATLTYGDGSASLSITAGGSVTLDWATKNTPTPHASTGTESTNMAQKHEAILQMVAQGRISPEEGNGLLDALDQ